MRSGYNINVTGCTGEAFDYPEVFFEEQIHEIRRIYPDQNQIKNATEIIKNSKQPIIISGGGVLYSEAEKELSEFAKKHHIPVTSTVMGIGCMDKDDPYYIGPIGCLGVGSANVLSKKTDLALAVGTKLGDFTTGSWTNFHNPDFKLISINAARFDVTKHRATPVVSDAKIGLLELSKALGDWKAPDHWYQQAVKETKEWINMLKNKVVLLIKKYLHMLMLLELFIEMLIQQILL